MFFVISKKFNKKEKHILFTNDRNISGVDGRWISTILSDLNIEVIIADFKYGLPKDNYSTRNQFYEFSILEYILQNDFNRRDRYLVLNSDRIFYSVRNLFKEITISDFISLEDNVPTGYDTNGLMKKDFTAIYSDLLDHKVNGIFYYPTDLLSRGMECLEKIFSGIYKGGTSVLHWAKKYRKKKLRR